MYRDAYTRKDEGRQSGFITREGRRLLHLTMFPWANW